MEKKYELTDETTEVYGKTLHRIRALRDFGKVKKGDLGGYLEKEDNLSHEGDCWIGGYACVYDDAKVYENAQVYGHAEVYGNAQVYDYAHIYGNAKIYGSADVCSDEWIGGDKVISTGEKTR
ncbi:hypothetical protein [Bartonella refiksaydamii]|uniref:hypothetical protein n=1 Tax=Bartonella refiksaydamii TaxID=2654951 RepID=UPI0012EC761D|nr:hypothetical protein [Bartonella refiksaydamii]